MPTTPASPPLALAAVRLLCSVCQVIQSEGNRDTCENQKCQLELAKTGVVYDDNGATRLSRKRGRVAKPSPRANKEPAQPEGPQRKPRLWVDVSDDEAEAASPPPPPPPPAFGVGDAVKGRYRATEYTKSEAAWGGSLFGTKWYAGEITACNPDGTFDILYEDGDTEVGVLTQFVKPFYAPRDWPDRALAMH